MESIETIEGRRGFCAHIVHDDEPRAWGDEGERFGTFRGPDGYGDEPHNPAYVDVAENVRDMRLCGRTVIPFRFEDYGSSGARIYETDAENANGFAYATPDKIRDEFERFGYSPRRSREKARALIRAEISEADDVLQGHVYGFVVKDGAGEHVDSCWGFVGSDLSYVRDEARSALSAAETDADQEDRERAEWAARDVLTV